MIKCNVTIIGRVFRAPDIKHDREGNPFVTFGVASLFASHHVFADGSHRTAIGPTAGVGAFYHLTDSWSLRFDAMAAMAVDSPCGMSYGISLGLQWSFGD